MWCDNTSAPVIAENPVQQSRIKHIQIDVHYVRDQILSKQLRVGHVPSSEQITDCLTKPLTHTRLNHSLTHASGF